MPVCRTHAEAADPRDDLLSRYMPLIVGVVSRCCGRYVRPGHDDEMQIGSVALVEACAKYEPARGNSWAGFAAQVIRRRVIDYMRQQQKYSCEVPVSPLAEEAAAEEPSLYRLEQAEAERRWHYSADRAALREEIAVYRERLAAHGITWRNLVQSVPEGTPARNSAIRAAMAVVSTPELLSYYRTCRRLPITGLADMRIRGCCRSSLDRKRRYILAVVILLMSADLPRLRDYLPRATTVGVFTRAGESHINEATHMSRR